MFKSLTTRSLSIYFVVVLLLSMLCSACNTSGGDASLASHGFARGGVWIDDLSGDPDSLIPNGSLKNVSAILDQAIYAPLFYGDAQGVLHPGLVKELPTVVNKDVSADLTTWTFHLRPHLFWSDGQPLNADDVKFTWQLWTNADFEAASSYGLSLIDSATVSADKLSITFHLKQPFAPFISLWADGLFAPLPMHHFSTMQPGQILRSADNLNPAVTSGPFMLSESFPGDHYTVIRNPHYYRAAEGLPYLDKIIFRVAADSTKILRDARAGSIDSAWFSDVANAAFYQRLPHYQLLKNLKSTSFEAMYFDFHNAVLANNPAVREAISLAVDRPKLIQQARNGLGVPLCTDHSAALQPGYEPDVLCPRFDLQAANNLLDQNGWIKGADGYRTRNNQKLEFKYSTTNDTLWRSTDELILQQDLQKIGIKLDIENYPGVDFYSSVLTEGKPGTYDIAEFTNSLNYDADDSALFSCSQQPPNGFNIDFYCNKNLDSLYTQEQSTLDVHVRQNIFKQIHQVYLTDFPFIPLYSPIDQTLVKNGVHNDIPAPEGALETINVWSWWCDNGQCPA